VRKAYVLIDTVEDKVASVASAVRYKRGVVAVDIVGGAHNIIAIVESKDTQAMAKATLVEIPGIEGVTNTVICPVIGTEDQAPQEGEG